MSKLKKYDLGAKVIGEVDLDENFLMADVSSQMIKDYIVALRANARQWSANTKGRSEVHHTTKKPHRQKGTGNARQGMLSAPQYKGGGIVFGPKPKFDQHIRINQKERRQAIRALLTEKINAGKVFIVDDKVFADTLKVPQTKSVVGFMKQLNIQGRPVLFVGEGTYVQVEEGKKVSVASSKHDTFKLSTRNVPRSVYALAANVNGYDLLVAHNLVLTESALNELREQLTK